MKRMLAVVAFLVLTLSLAAAQRLPEVARPENYKLTFTPDLDNARFAGDETITIRFGLKFCGFDAGMTSTVSQPT